MAELLVRVVDKVNRNDPHLDAGCTKRGDVIAVREDGWRWGKRELDSLDWRILRVPELPVGEAEALLAPELGTDPVPSPMLQRRAFKLDLDADPALSAFAAEARVDQVKEIEVVREVKDEEGKPVLDPDGKPVLVETVEVVTVRRADVLDVTAKAIQDVTVAKTPIEDPKVIGEDPRVIG